MIAVQFARTAPPIATAFVGPNGLSKADLFTGIETGRITGLIAGPIYTGGAARYTHNQPSASATWVVNHLKGQYPAVIQVVSVGGVIGFGYSVHHISENQLHIYFGQPFAGTALVE